MMTVAAAKKLVKDEALRLGLKYEALTGKTQYFDGSPAVCLTIKNATPNPLYEDLQIFARVQRIVLSVYVDGVSG